jgi:hypothetical protein
MGVNIGIRIDQYVLSNDSAKARPFDQNVPFCSSTDANNFEADMFPFSVAIRPDHECVGASGLSKKVILDSFLILINRGLDCRVEELKRVTGVPFPMTIVEVVPRQVPDNTSNSIEGICLRIIEFVILDISSSSFILRNFDASETTCNGRKNTHRRKLPT